jgi:four helix bundle protein
LLQRFGMAKAPEAYTTRTFAYACRIVHLYRELNARPNFPFSISRQLLRSGTAIGANIEEARTAASRRDMAAKFRIALREARETKYWLRLIVATSLAPAELVQVELREADELVAILHRTVERLATG